MFKSFIAFSLHLILCANGAFLPSCLKEPWKKKCSTPSSCYSLMLFDPKLSSLLSTSCEILPSKRDDHFNPRIVLKSTAKKNEDLLQQLHQEHEEESLSVDSVPSLSEALKDIHDETIRVRKKKKANSSKKTSSKKTTKKRKSGKEKVTTTTAGSKNKSKTKGEIKRLKFLMNQEVERLIQANDPSAPQVAEENIHKLQQLYEREGDVEYNPRILNYNILVRAYGKSQRDDAPILAENTLKRITHMYEETGDENIKPTVITYTEVIDSYARSKRRNAAEHAERILLDMMEEAEYGSDILPTSITCDVVINAWAKRGTKEGAQRAENILEKMEYLRTMGNNEIQPSTYSFATVISAWAKSGAKQEGAERAEYILSRMVDFRKKIVSSEGEEGYAARLSPDTVVYNSCIDAWARSGDARAGTKAEALLRQMEEQLQKGVTDAAPDSITYNSVINCYANSRHITAAKSAEKVLKKMEIAAKENLDGSSRIAPNTRTYNQVLKCYASSKLPGAARRADAILKYMLISKNTDIQPDVISFCTCLDVWAKSKEKGKAEKSNELLQKLLKVYEISGNDRFKPTVMVYNTVLNCCAFSAYTDEEEKKKALSIAVSLFNDLKQSSITRPDAITYGTLIKCVANLVPFGNVRNKMASDIFIKCRDEGLVNGLVFDEIRRAVPGRVMAELLTETMNSGRRKKPFKEWVLRDLPRSWKANVVERKPKKKNMATKKKKNNKISANNKAEENKDATPVPIRPIRRIRPETSWQSGKDL